MGWRGWVFSVGMIIAVGCFTILVGSEPPDGLIFKATGEEYVLDNSAKVFLFLVGSAAGGTAIIAPLLSWGGGEDEEHGDRDGGPHIHL